jgi:uncharacterized membrane protein (UPF0127 family)
MSFLTPMLGGSQSGLAIRNERNQRLLANHLLPAFDSRTRRTGLLRHDSLAEGSAMVIAPTSAIHTFFMRFAIDVAFITREGRIVKVCHNLRPWRIAIAPGAFAVVELPSGTLARCNTVWGDALAIVPAEHV